MNKTKQIVEYIIESDINYGILIGYVESLIIIKSVASEEG